MCILFVVIQDPNKRVINVLCVVSESRSLWRPKSGMALIVGKSSHSHSTARVVPLRRRLHQTLVINFVAGSESVAKKNCRIKFEK